uniref:DUF4166 domain-containing protein n=1 Tax=uncultured Caulobacter sp. TaxID=158749 RepID=UPI0025D9F429|nr:DUF4166 domain-containing protein [uncultured Caulobacter sp.]
MTRRIVLVGASGVFGARLAAMIARWPDVTLVLAARRREPLEALRDRLESPAAIEIMTFDREAPEGLTAFAVVDAAGPFQTSDLRLARAALAAGAHYVDLADGRAFVEQFPEDMAEAVAASGRWAITGASSTPALSTAALDRLTAGWSRIDAVTTAISPGADAPRGPSVIAAIFSWTGRPVRVFETGAWTRRPGWSGSRQELFPGLGRRWVALAETPDLDLLPRRYKPRHVGRFEAGLELSIAHHGLALLGWMRRKGLVRDLAPFAKPLGALADLLARFGTDRGGMVVEAVGKDAQRQSIRARWGLWAEAGAGPNTPASPAAAILRALLDNRLDGPPRATPCVGLLPLEDLLAPLALFPIRTRIDMAFPRAEGVFPRALGPRLLSMPEAVQHAHDGATRTLIGWARGRGAGGPARLVRLLQGLPEPGRHETTVSIAPDATGETWTRQFGLRRFRSRIERVREDAYAFEETAGPLTFRFHAADYPGGFSWMFEGWRIGPLSLPAAWAPRVRARTFARDGVYRFRVLVAHPWIGVIFGYSGRLTP